MIELTYAERSAQPAVSDGTAALALVDGDRPLAVLVRGQISHMADAQLGNLCDALAHVWQPSSMPLQAREWLRVQNLTFRRGSLRGLSAREFIEVFSQSLGSSFAEARLLRVIQFALQQPPAAIATCPASTRRFFLRSRFDRMEATDGSNHVAAAASRSISGWSLLAPLPDGSQQQIASKLDEDHAVKTLDRWISALNQVESVFFSLPRTKPTSP